MPITARNRLRVIFRGLCVFYSVGGKVQVLIVDARKPDMLLGNYNHRNFQEPIPHTPLVLIPQNLFPNAISQNDRPKYISDENYLIGLTKYKITITPNASISLDKESLFNDHIPNISQLVSGSQIKTNIHTSLTDLSGFLDIETGFIGIPSSSQTSSSPHATEFVKTKFYGAASPYNEPRLYATSVYWEFLIAENSGKYPFTISFYDISNNLQKSYELELPKNSANNVIPGHIFVTNMPSAIDNRVSDYFFDQPDRDFALTYQILQTPVYTPLPQRIKEADEEQTWPPLACGIARFN